MGIRGPSGSLAAARALRVLELVRFSSCVWLFSGAALGAFVDIPPAPSRPPVALPERVEVSWKANAQGGLVSGATVVGDARFAVVTSEGHLMLWNEAGRVLWRVSLPANATSPPLPLHDRLMLTTRRGTLVTYSHRGSFIAQLELPIPEPTEPARLVPLDGDTVAVISGSDVVISGSDYVRSHLKSTDRIIDARPHPDGEGLRYVTAAGDYYDWQGHLEPTLLHRFANDQVALTDDGAFIAVQQTLWQYSNQTRRLFALGALGTDQLASQPMLGYGAVFVWTKEGQLAVFPTSGEPPTVWSGLLQLQRTRLPPVIGDPSGRVATIAGDGRLLVGRLGETTLRRGPAFSCSGAAGVAPLKRVLVVTCASGHIFGLAASPPSPPGQTSAVPLAPQGPEAD